MMYIQHRVYVHRDKASIIYICLESVETRKFAVQQAEFFSVSNSKSRAATIEQQILELFAETSPEDRLDWHDSLVGAIHQHNIEFGN